MTTERRLGIWMDHSTAHLMEFSKESGELKIIDSAFTHQVKEDTLSKSEHVMHNKEQHQQHDYYKKLGDAILHYEDVILFGPTHAKEELHNLLKADHRFAKINIETLHADKMTENQQHAFVREHFTKKLV